MTMTCDDRDSDLLLMAHGELDLARRTRTRLHVQRCARCQKRIGEFGLVSAAFAATLGPSSAERPKVANSRPASTPQSMGGIVLVSALVVVIGIALFFAARSALTLLPSSQTPPAILTNTPHTMPGIHHGPPGCKPGIVSDKCR